jgi:glycosyltransferase involved in cell wall biosynthesis
MKILAINYEYTLSGSSLVLLRLVEHLREAGHDLSVCASIPRDGPLKEAYRQRGFPILDPSFHSATDLAICNTALTSPLLLRFAPSTKTIWWIHEEKYGLAHLLQNPSQIAAFAQASAVVFPIAYLRDAVYRSFIYKEDPARFQVIPIGIPPIDVIPTVRTENDPFRVVSVGAIYPRKRHEDLIRAMALYRGPAKCIIAGQFYTLPDDCLKLISANPDRFELAGELDHAAVLRLVADADVFCLPSESEVMPLASLEAAMLKRPIILSDLPVYEGIWRHGRNCLLYPVGAIGMLSQSLAMLAGNAELRTRLGAAARQTAMPYTEAAFFARFDALLNTL